MAYAWNRDTQDEPRAITDTKCYRHDRPWERVEPSGPWVGFDEIMGACPECRDRRITKRDLDCASSEKSRADGTVLQYSILLDYTPSSEKSEYIKMAIRKKEIEEWNSSSHHRRKLWGTGLPDRPNLPPYRGLGQWNHGAFPEKIAFDEAKRQKTLADRGIDFWDIGTFCPVDEGQIQMEVRTDNATGEQYSEKTLVQHGTLNQFPPDDTARLYRVTWVDRREVVRLVSIHSVSRIRYNSERDAWAALIQRMGLNEDE